LRSRASLIALELQKVIEVGGTLMSRVPLGNHDADDEEDVG
jgi:hypothetical protein